MARTEPSYNTKTIEPIFDFMESVGDRLSVEVGETEIREMKNEVERLLGKIVSFECNKKCAPITQQLEDKNRIVQDLQHENLGLREKVENLEGLEKENEEKKNEIEKLTDELKNIQNELERQRLLLLQQNADYTKQRDDDKKEKEILLQKISNMNQSLKAANNCLESANANSVQLGEDRLQQETKIQKLELENKKLKQFGKDAQNIFELYQRMHQRLESRVGNDSDNGNISGVLNVSLPSHNENPSPCFVQNSQNDDEHEANEVEDSVSSSSQPSSRSISRKSKTFNYSTLNDGIIRNFVCDECRDTFSREQDLKTHKTRMHPEAVLTPNADVETQSAEKERETMEGSPPKRLRFLEGFPTISRSSVSRPVLFAPLGSVEQHENEQENHDVLVGGDIPRHLVGETDEAVNDLSFDNENLPDNDDSVSGFPATQFSGEQRSMGPENLEDGRSHGEILQPVVCPTCKKEYRNEKGLKIHIKRKHHRKRSKAGSYF